MSNPESFIEEVSEEVRRDRLYGLVKRWGWVALLAVLVIVGGAAWTEWQASQRAAKAQAFGDAVLDALGGADMAERRAALDAIEPADANQAAILSLLSATAQANGDEADPEASRDALLALSENPDLGVVYRHLALFKVMTAGGTGDAARDAAILDELATPGAPYRPLAVEQQALRALEQGDEGTAITLLRLLTEDAEATEPLRRRATQLIVALGATPEAA